MPRTLFRKTNVKIALLLAIVAVSMVVMGVLLSGMQESLSRSSYDTEMEEEASELKELLASAEEEASQNKETFDAIYQSKAMSVAFMAANDAGFEATDAKMAEYRQLLDVDNVLVVIFAVSLFGFDCKVELVAFLQIFHLVLERLQCQA